MPTQCFLFHEIGRFSSHFSKKLKINDISITINYTCFLTIVYRKRAINAKKNTDFVEKLNFRISKTERDAF